MKKSRILAQAATYCIEAKCAHVAPFFNRLDDLFTEDECSLGAFKASLERLNSKIKKNKAKNAEYFLDVLAVKDLKKSIKYLENNNMYKQCLQHCQIEESLILYNDLIFKEMLSIGVNLKKPSLFFVEKYGENEENKNFVAVTYNNDDKGSECLQEGIYFRKNLLRPYYSIYMLCHEYIHAAKFGRTNNRMGGVLEEGIAEFLGCIYISLKIFGAEITKNLFTYHRLSSWSDKQMDLYLDYCRQAYVLYIHYGLKGLVSLLNMSRQQVSDIEKEIASGGIKKLSLEKGEWPQELNDLAEELLIQKPRHYFCNPIAYAALPLCEVGKLLEDIAMQMDISNEALERALVEIEKQPRVIDIKKRKITASCAKEALLSMRYTLK